MCVYTDYCSSRLWLIMSVHDAARPAALDHAATMSRTAMHSPNTNTDSSVPYPYPQPLPYMPQPFWLLH